jgi:hypothetical protein
MVNSLYYLGALRSVAKALEDHARFGALLHGRGIVRENVVLVASALFILVAWGATLYISLAGQTTRQIVIALTMFFWAVLIFMAIRPKQPKEIGKYLFACLTSFVTGLLVRYIFVLAEGK